MVEQQGELTGIARSIRQVYDTLGVEDVPAVEEESPDTAAAVEAPPDAADVDAPVVAVSELGPTSEPVPSGGDDEDEEPPPHPLQVALREAVDAYLMASSSERDPLEADVREAWSAARAGNLIDALAEAADMLLVQPVPDPAAETLARSLMNAMVEARMAIRLADVREEPRREALVQAYARLGDSMAEAAAEALPAAKDWTARRIYVRLLVALGDSGMRVVERMVEDTHWWGVRNGIAVLAELGGERAVMLLTGTLANDDARVRKEAVMALAKIGGENAGDLVVGMLEDPSADVRAAAARAVAVLRVERGMRPLLRRVEEDTDDTVVERALRALGELGDPAAVPTIEKKAVGGLLRKAPTDVRIAAYSALHTIGTPRAMSLVQAATSDRDVDVRDAVNAILAQRD